MKTALVTGASSGIGEATARRLNRDGWRVLLVARREDRLQMLAESFGTADWLAVDLTEETAPERVAAFVEEKAGRLDLLVNNAGGSKRAAFGDEDGGYENVRQVMELNFDSVVRLTEALLPLLRRSAPSAIVNVSSMMGRISMARSGAYSASKFALAGWSEALRHEEQEHGVHVGLVLPGFIATEGFPQEDLKKGPTRVIVSRPEVVAEAVMDAGPGGKAERAVPRFYGAVPVLRAVFPAIARRVTGGMRR